MAHLRATLTALVRNRKLLYAATGVFLLGVVFGLAMPLPDENTLTEHGEVLEPNVDYETISFTEILTNNLVVGGFLVGGSATAGLTTVVNLLFNGLFLAFALRSMAANGHVLGIVYAVAPHAVIEYPAYLIAGGAGFKMPYELLQYLRRRKEYIINREEFVELLYLIVLAGVLIVLGSIVESTLTTHLARQL